MGASLVGIWAFLPPGTGKVNAEAAIAAVNQLTDEELERYAEHAYGGIDGLDDDEDGNALARARKSILNAVTNLAEDINVLQNEFFVFNTPDGYTCVLSGGMSWGGDPTDGFTWLDNLQNCEKVWAALGFLP